MTSKIVVAFLTLWQSLPTIAQPNGVAKPAFTVDSVQSADKTTIGYRKIGQGPGLVILHGTFEYWESHLELAEALADSYTVYLPDRRGRGASRYPSTDYVLQHDIEDLNAVLTKTGCRLIFAVSSGALITLNAALSYPSDHKIALYEPPMAMDKEKAATGLRQFDAQVAAGQLPEAMLTAMQTAKLGPKAFDYLPRFIRRGFAKKMLKASRQPVAPGSVSVAQLIPTIHHDFVLTLENLNAYSKYRSIKGNVLLLGGTKSPSYLTASLDRLEKACPSFRRLKLEGLGHGGSGSTEWGGDPNRVATELKRYFSGNALATPATNDWRNLSKTNR